MDFYAVIASRRTVRDFTPAAIADDTLARILSAGMQAPTNDHLRDWHFIVVRDKDRLAALLRLIPQDMPGADVAAILDDWQLRDPCQRAMYTGAIPRQYRMLAEAACVIVPLFRQKMPLLRPQNLSALNAFASIWCCLENVFLAATAEGYACALRVPLGDEAGHARDVLGFPADYCMPCFVALGKPDAGAPIVAQKDCGLAGRVHFEGWRRSRQPS